MSGIVRARKPSSLSALLFDRGDDGSGELLCIDDLVGSELGGHVTRRLVVGSYPHAISYVQISARRDMSRIEGDLIMLLISWIHYSQ